MANLRSRITVRKLPSPQAGSRKRESIPLRFLLHEIKHGIDLALPGQHLAMIRNSFFRSNLCSLHRCPVYSNLQSLLVSAIGSELEIQAHNCPIQRCQDASLNARLYYLVGDKAVSST